MFNSFKYVLIYVTLLNHSVFSMEGLSKDEFLWKSTLQSKLQSDLTFIINKYDLDYKKDIDQLYFNFILQSKNFFGFFFNREVFGNSGIHKLFVHKSRSGISKRVRGKLYNPSCKKKLKLDDDEDKDENQTIFQLNQIKLKNQMNPIIELECLLSLLRHRVVSMGIDFLENEVDIKKDYFVKSIILTTEYIIKDIYDYCNEKLKSHPKHSRIETMLDGMINPKFYKDNYFTALFREINFELHSGESTYIEDLAILVSFLVNPENKIFVDSFNKTLKAIYNSKLELNFTSKHPYYEEIRTFFSASEIGN